jgi:hypothetical protein
MVILGTCVFHLSCTWWYFALPIYLCLVSLISYMHIDILVQVLIVAFYFLLFKSNWCRYLLYDIHLKKSSLIILWEIMQNHKRLDWLNASLIQSNVIGWWRILNFLSERIFHMVCKIWNCNRLFDNIFVWTLKKFCLFVCLYENYCMNLILWNKHI